MLNNTEPYDSAKHVGVVERVTEMINTMRRRKGLNKGGTYGTLQSLIIPTILYPLKYANGWQKEMQALKKKKNC